MHTHAEKKQSAADNKKTNTPRIPSQIRPVAPNATGIPDTMKTRFENLSGFSFDDVRIHYNSDKPAQLQALAYTRGNQVYVGPGQEMHLGHELGHVVQQKTGTVRKTLTIGGLPVNDDKHLEHQAEHQILPKASPVSPANPGVVQAFGGDFSSMSRLASMAAVYNLLEKVDGLIRDVNETLSVDAITNKMKWTPKPTVTQSINPILLGEITAIIIGYQLVAPSDGKKTFAWKTQQKQACAAKIKVHIDSIILPIKSKLEGAHASGDFASIYDDLKRCLLPAAIQDAQKMFNPGKIDPDMPPLSMLAPGSEMQAESYRHMFSTGMFWRFERDADSGMLKPLDQDEAVEKGWSDLTQDEYTVTVPSAEHDSESLTEINHKMIQLIPDIAAKLRRNTMLTHYTISEGLWGISNEGGIKSKQQLKKEDPNVRNNTQPIDDIGIANDDFVFFFLEPADSARADTRFGKIKLKMYVALHETLINTGFIEFFDFITPPPEKTEIGDGFRKSIGAPPVSSDVNALKSSNLPEHSHLTQSQKTEAARLAAPYITGEGGTEFEYRHDAEDGPLWGTMVAHLKQNMIGGGNLMEKIAFRALVEFFMLGIQPEQVAGMDEKVLCNTIVKNLFRMQVLLPNSVPIDAFDSIEYL